MWLTHTQTIGMIEDLQEHGKPPLITYLGVFAWSSVQRKVKIFNVFVATVGIWHYQGVGIFATFCSSTSEALQCIFEGSLN